MNARLNSDGSIVLPQEVRTALDLSPGDELTLEPCDGGFKLFRSFIDFKLPVIPDITAATAGPVLTSGLKEAIAKKNLQTLMPFIKGVGPKLTELLSKRGVTTVEDALYLLPHRYEDRREVRDVARLRTGVTEVFSGTVLSADVMSTKGGRRFFEALVGDKTGSVS